MQENIKLLIKIGLIALVLYILLVLCSCNSNKGTVTSPELPKLDFEIITVGSHQYLMYQPGYTNGMMCHYEDCTNPVHKHDTVNIYHSLSSKPGDHWNDYYFGQQYMIWKATMLRSDIAVNFNKYPYYFGPVNH